MHWDSASALKPVAHRLWTITLISQAETGFPLQLTLSDKGPDIFPSFLLHLHQGSNDHLWAVSCVS